VSENIRVPERVPTLGEMLASSEHNRDVADWQVRAVQRKLAQLPIGDPLRMSALIQLSLHQAEHEHWANYVLYYRLRVQNEGESTVPRVKVGGAHRPKVDHRPATEHPKHWAEAQQEEFDAALPF
jgi:hypothetical protein